MESLHKKGLKVLHMVDIEDGNKAQIKKHVKDQVAEIKKAIADTESIDLRNLLDPVKVIAKNEKLIEDLDKEFGAGAAPCSWTTEEVKMGGNLIATEEKAKAEADKKREPR